MIAGHSLPRWLVLRYPSDEARAVFAALILAGKPISNDELARLMRVSKSEASKRVTALDGCVLRVRKGREVLISLH
jgi:hypothetical protein